MDRRSRRICRLMGHWLLAGILVLAAWVIPIQAATSNGGPIARWYPNRQGPGTATSPWSSGGIGEYTVYLPLVMVNSGASSTSGTVDTPGGPVQVGLQGGTFIQGPSAANAMLPSGFQAPYGAIAFTAQTLQGGILNVTLTFPQDIPRGAVLKKYVNSAWQNIPGAQISGNTATYQVQDGGPLDGDGQANGQVVDPVALLVPPFIISDPYPRVLVIPQGGTGSFELVLEILNPDFEEDIALLLTDEEGNPIEGISLGIVSKYWVSPNEARLKVSITINANIPEDVYVLYVVAVGVDSVDIDLSPLILGVVSAPITWARTYGGSGADGLTAVLQARDGGYIVVGSTGSFGAGGGDAWVVKLDPWGDVEWEYTYGENTEELASDIQLLDQSEGYLIAAAARIFDVRRDIWLVPIADDGLPYSVSPFFAHNYLGRYGKSDTPVAVRRTVDGGYIIVAHTEGMQDVHDAQDVLILKLEPNENGQNALSWVKQYSTSIMFDKVTDVEVYGGLIYVSGYNANGKAWLMVIDQQGEMYEMKVYGGTSRPELEAIALDIGDYGGPSIVGAGEAYNEQSGEYEPWVVKWSWSGELVWQKTYPRQEEDVMIEEWVNDIQVADDGGYVVLGGRYGGSLKDDTDIWLMKLDRDGNVLWRKNYGGPRDEYAYRLLPTADGGYVVAGMVIVADFGWGQRDTDAFVMKVDSEGNVTGCSPSFAVWNSWPMERSGSVGEASLEMASSVVVEPFRGYVELFAGSSSASGSAVCTP